MLRACIQGRIELRLSPAIVEELTEVLSRPKLRVVAAHPDLPAVLSWLCDPARLVIPGVTLDVVREDRDDDRAIECAVESGAEAVVTGDDHLLRLGTYKGIAFPSPHEACARWGI